MRIKARIDLARLPEALHEEARADNRNYSQRDLRYNQGTSEPVRVQTGAASPGLLERVVHVRPSRRPGRTSARQNRDREGYGSREQQNRGIEARLKDRRGRHW